MKSIIGNLKDHEIDQANQVIQNDDKINTYPQIIREKLNANALELPDHRVYSMIRAITNSRINDCLKSWNKLISLVEFLNQH